MKELGLKTPEAPTVPKLCREGFQIRNESQEKTSLEDAEEDCDEIGW